MRALARAGRNLVFKSVGEAFALASFLVLFVIAARILGAEQYGRYNYAASLTALALIIMDMGLNTLFVRDVARRRELLSVYGGTILVLKTVLGLCVLAGLALFLGLGSASLEDLQLVLAVAVVQILWNLAEVGIAGLNAVERMDQEAVLKTISRMTALALVSGFLFFGWGLWGLVAGLGLANALAACLALGLLRRQAPFKTNFKADFLAPLVKESLPMAVTSVFIMIYSRVDMVLLQMMGRAYTEIGWYAAAVRVIDGVGIVPALVARALLPVFSSLAGGDIKDLQRLYTQGMRLLVFLGLPAAVGLVAVRHEVAVVIFGPQYEPTAQVFLWFGPMVALFFINFLQLNVLTALRLQRLAALATGICLVVNVVLDFWWIPVHGYMGAGAATFCTELILLVLGGIFLRFRGGLNWPYALALRPAAATAVMALALYFTKDHGLTINIAAAVIVYGLASLALKAVTLAELRRFLDFVRGGGLAPDREGT